MDEHKRTTRLDIRRPIIRHRLEPYWCASCLRLVTMVATEEAALMRASDTNTIENRCENHTLHTMKTSTGHLMICLPSLGL
jgi:hypothetical protein